MAGSWRSPAGFSISGIEVAIHLAVGKASLPD